MLSQMAIFHFLWLRLYMHIYTHACIYVSLFLCSSIDGSVSCFHVFAVVINAAVHRRVHVSFGVSALCALDKYPEVKLLSHMVVVI